jgi:ketosteroid isomerase-like protein
MRLVSKLILPLAAVVSFAAPALAQRAADDETKFGNREAAVWEAVKNKQVDALRKVMSDDYVAVYDAGSVGRDDELKGISQMTLRSYRIDDLKVRRIDPSNVIVTYKAVVDGDMNGKSASGTYNAMSVWHRMGNRWNVAAHSEVKAP